MSVPECDHCLATDHAATQATADALVAELAHIAGRLDEHKHAHYLHIKVSAFDALRDLIRAAGIQPRRNR